MASPKLSRLELRIMDAIWTPEGPWAAIVGDAPKATPGD